MKKYNNIMLGVLIFFSISIIFIGILFNVLISPVNKKDTKNIDIVVNKGDTTRIIAERLKESDLVRSRAIVLVYSRIYSDLKVREGVFKLNKSMSLHEILIKLDEVSDDTINIMLKEGQTIKDLAKEVKNKLNIDEEEFLNSINNKKYLNELIVKYDFLTNEILNEDIYYPLEGYLFPNTHNVYLNAKPKDIVEKFLNNFYDIIKPFEKNIKNSNLSLHEILILASMAEVEGQTLEDRKNIVGVFINRLNTNFPLGSDVTAHYAFHSSLKEPYLDIWSRTYNPYNTRGPNMNGKLPIGPINNPSLRSIDATINYIKNDYFYFVADKSMKVHFMKTENEFYQNKDRLMQQGK